MQITETERAEIIREHRSGIAKKAAKTLRRKYGRNYFKELRQKGVEKLSPTLKD